MCGIVGILSGGGKSVDREKLRAVTGLLAHRGPDGEGLECVNGFGAGHRRLSIIDLSSLGAQPMYSASGDIVVTFNGEIFNYVELKKELEREGVCFRSTSDTEVMLEGFARFGCDFFGKLNGQFAAAFYNKRDGSLVLLRDRMGEKPLFYSISGGTLIFASELKAILHWQRLAGTQVELNYQAFGNFLALNYVPFSQTLVKGALSLDPGSYLVFREGKSSIKKYWESAEAAPVIDLDRGLSEFSALLLESVRIRLRSDVPVGMFLSGGLDSSTVLHAVVQQATNITAFIAHFQEASFSEAPRAVAVCQKLGIPYKIIEVALQRDEVLAQFEKLVYHCDTPLADSSALPVSLLSQETAKHVKVVLSGDGGDELFGGYLTYLATLLSAALPVPLRKFGFRAGTLLSLLPASNRKVGLLEKLERFCRSLNLPPGAAHFAWNGMFGAAERAKLLHPDFSARLSLDDTFNVLQMYFNVDAGKPSLSQLMYADQRCYLPDDILTKVDRMTMMHGLEARPIFLDHRIVEFSRRLSRELILDGFKGKRILREYLKRSAPWYSLNDKKQGFSIPVHLWLRTVLKDFAWDILSSEFTRDLGLYNQQYLLKLWQQHQKRERNLGFELWGILVSLVWARMFLKSMRV